MTHFECIIILTHLTPHQPAECLMLFVTVTLESVSELVVESVQVVSLSTKTQL